MPVCPSPDASVGDCNNLRARGEIVDFVVNADPSRWPAPTGGAIEDGEYDLVAAESTGAQSFSRRHTMRVTAQRPTEWVIRPGTTASSITYNTDAVISGVTMSLTLTCGQDQVIQPPPYRFSAAGGEVTIYYRDDATGTQTLTTYRRRCR